MTLVFGAFIVLHGLVHLLYFGQSRRVFELKPRLLWPDGSWAFSRLLGGETTRLLGSAACVVAGIGLMAGGVGLLVMAGWWQPVVIGAAAWSAALFILLWDGQMHDLPEKGGIGILISLTILFVVLILRWPTP